MDTSTNIAFKILRCSVSFILLAPSVYDTIMMAWLLQSLFEGESLFEGNGAKQNHDDYFTGLNEDVDCFEFFGSFACLIFC